MSDEGEPIVEIFTDGACLGNPGPGGWAAILRYKNYEKEIWGGSAKTTNNRMELIAVISSLKILKANYRIKIYTDSQYVQKGITEWIFTWIKRDFKTRQGNDRKNADLWRELYDLSSHYTIVWEWVKGHSGHPENERVDKLANRAAYQARREQRDFEVLDGEVSRRAV